MIDKTISVAGYTLPFFPMRPRTGRVLRADNVDDLVDTLADGQWFPQKKLNGDRALLAVVGGKVYLANRHGSWLKHPVSNTSAWLAAGDETLLDGEVWKKTFYPFEALVVNGSNLMGSGPRERARAAEELCLTVEQNWIFTFPDVDWIRKLDGNGSDWEGVVLKQQGSPYIPLGSENQESGAWLKRKWVTT